MTKDDIRRRVQAATLWTGRKSNILSDGRRAALRGGYDYLAFVKQGRQKNRSIKKN